MSLSAKKNDETFFFETEYKEPTLFKTGQRLGKDLYLRAE